MAKMTKEQEAELLKAFEEMLSKDDEENEDFGYFDPSLPFYPSDYDLEYPDTPPPIPKEALKKEENKCEHKETKKVFFTNSEAYIMCKKCKADLGDAK